MKRIFQLFLLAILPLIASEQHAGVEHLGICVQSLERSEFIRYLRVNNSNMHENKEDKIAQCVRYYKHIFEILKESDKVTFGVNFLVKGADFPDKLKWETEESFRLSLKSALKELGISANVAQAHALEKRDFDLTILLEKEGSYLYGQMKFNFSGFLDSSLNPYSNALMLATPVQNIEKIKPHISFNLRQFVAIFSDINSIKLAKQGEK